MDDEVKPRRLVVGISGATGIAYGMRVLELARKAGVETHLVATPAGRQTRRRLVLMIRETPLTLGHLRAMAAVTDSGGIVMPPVPAFYLQPHRVPDIIDHSAGRALDLLDIDVPDLPR
ncbi:flavoprotein [Nocardia sp. NPDC059091]|uniref:flavoprotein n=1 Tax=unclassified Nocardia TaxID=2637762 RepID=UPI0036887881